MLTKTKIAFAAALILGSLSIQNRKGADAFGLAASKGRAVHPTPATQEDNYGSEAGKD